MKNEAQKNIIFLIIAGLVFAGVNAVIIVGTRNGQIAPVDNLVLWGAFVVLNVCSLLWATSLLGLQPIVVAVSYMAGGFMAFQGARLLPDVHIAEVASAGATYGAFGALVVGNATTKVRLVFFSRKQVPLVFVIVALLLVDGLLNSRVSNAGWNVIVNALILPFVLSGVIVGLVWALLTRFSLGQFATKKPVEAVVGIEEKSTTDAAVGDESARLVFQMPENTGMAEPMEVVVPTPELEPVATEVFTEPVKPLPLRVDPIRENPAMNNFFPLEIDKGKEILLAEEDPNLMNVAARVAKSAPERFAGAGWDGEESNSLPEESPASIPDPGPVAESEVPVFKKRKMDSNDWLSTHLDLINKLN